DVAGQPIDADQQRLARQPGQPHHVHQALNEVEVTHGADHAAQPQPARHGQGHRHPQAPALTPGIQLVGLDVAQVHLVGVEEVLLDPLAVAAGLVLPVGDRALVEPEGGDDGLQGAAVDQQGDSGDEQGTVLVQAVEGGAGGGREGLAAAAADQTPLLVGVDFDVALAAPPFAGAGGVVKECAVGAHGVAPTGSDGVAVPSASSLAPLLPTPPRRFTVPWGATPAACSDCLSAATP